MQSTANTRIEKDSLGDVQVPSDAYYGAQTQRARENFPISGIGPGEAFVTATVLVKRAAAQVNAGLGMLDSAKAKVIEEAADEILAGKLRDQFVVDVFQAGAGTSHNMNANEVIANRAVELMGGQRGDYSSIHPNDHVNMAQSTNDVIPTTIRVSTSMTIPALIDVLGDLEKALSAKAQEFDHIVKAGRTHLQDAVPVRLGQEFGAYASAVANDTQRIQRAAEGLRRLGIGGTAAGTGLNAHPEYHQRMMDSLAQATGIPYVSSGNLFESMQNTADFLDTSASLRTLAVTLARVSNDFRMLSSGPMTGLDEVRMPPVQPGSSIMPGKVNPVMAEMLNMICFHVIGNDTCVMMACEAGQLELNVMMPIIAYNLLQSIEILTNGVRVFIDKCVNGITANEEACARWFEGSMGLATALNPYIGYSQAAKIAQEALASGKTVRQVVKEKGILPEAELEDLLSPRGLTEPRVPKFS